MNAKYEINIETRAVVSNEFCVLKCKNWTAGNMTRIIDVITFTQIVLEQVAVFYRK